MGIGSNEKISSQAKNFNIESETVKKSITGVLITYISTGAVLRKNNTTTNYTRKMVPITGRASSFLVF